MKRFVRLLDLIFIVALAFGVLFFPGFRRAEAQDNTPPTPEIDQAIRDALADAVASNQPHILGFLINDVEVNEIFYAADGRTALVWLQQRDPDTGEVIGREPGLAIATNPNGLTSKSTDWTVSIQSTSSFGSALSNLPPELVTQDLLDRYAVDEAGALDPKAAQTFTGYKLPWSNALNIKITGSVGHFLDYNSCAEVYCRYAYDFWNPDASNRMFPLLAAKGGVVWAYKETCNNGDTQCTNYLVLKDDSTTPTTYQLYYHLARSSVPDNFVSKVTYVPQGGYIGNVDDTGASTDHHLHFMVYTNTTNSAYSWGYSVRILFGDVPYNGGEPRTCAETINYPNYGTQCSMGGDGKKGGSDDNYLSSGNVGSNPPKGTLNAPQGNTVVTTGSLVVSGTASDNLGINKVQILGNYDGTWRVLGDANYANGAYSKTLDLCALGIPDGPMSLAARIFDVEGNWAARYTGLRQVFKNYSCTSGGTPPPAPACTPAAGQIGVYSDVNFSGSCLKLGAGKVTAGNLGGLNNKIASIQVSSGICATLFDRDNSDPLGRTETLAASDYNLADNRIGVNLTSSITIEDCSAQVDEPFLTFPGNRVDADGNSRVAPNPAGPTSADSLLLAWTGGEGATGFSSSLTLNGQVVKSLAKTNTNSWSVGTLAPGNYTWRVTAEGGGSNSTDLAFTVSAGALPAGSAVTAPKTFDLEDGAPGWTGSGLWKLTSLDKPLRGPTNAWIYSTGSNFNDATYRAGDLTSPPISIPASGSYYLRFRYYSDVEGNAYLNQRIATQHWDQRRVQVSTDGGVSFADLYQISDDTQGIIWLDSPAISLSAYAGKTIRLRFKFDALDGLDNGGLGWAVDEVRVDSSAPENCADNNSAPASAQAITINGPVVNASICPGGDTDYYAFTGSAGTPVSINLDAKSLNAGDPLDSFIALLDANGRDVLTLNDDEDPNNTADPFRDSLINTVLPRTGTYYVRVRAWDHPGAGGSAYTYRLGLSQIVAARPTSVSLSKPHDPLKLPVVPFIVEAAVVDHPSGGGIRQVDFFWHSADWENGSWIKFGSDTTSADGWWAIFDPTFNNSQDPTRSTVGSSFYILATNTGGGANGLLIGQMQPDLTAPASTLNALPKQVNSTAVQLTWAAQDLQNDIDHFEFRYRANGGAWTLWDQKPAGYLRSAWFIGAPGTYEFQMQAVDQASNQEGFPGASEAGVTMNGTCVDDGSDQARSAAQVQALNTSAVHPLCQNDVDWVKFNAAKDQEVFIFLASSSGGAAVHARLTNEAGTTQYFDKSAAGPGSGLNFLFKAPADGIYFLEITPADARIYGQDVKYLVYLGEPHLLHLPLIGH